MKRCKVTVSWVERDSEDIDVATLITKHRDEYFAITTEPEWERPSTLMNQLLDRGKLAFVPLDADDIDWDWDEADYEALIDAHPWIAPTPEDADPAWIPAPQCPGQVALFDEATR